jgi:hypothetical protein
VSLHPVCDYISGWLPWRMLEFLRMTECFFADAAGSIGLP